MQTKSSAHRAEGHQGRGGGGGGLCELCLRPHAVGQLLHVNLLPRTKSIGKHLYSQGPSE